MKDTTEVLHEILTEVIEAYEEYEEQYRKCKLTTHEDLLDALDRARTRLFTEVDY